MMIMTIIMMIMMMMRIYSTLSIRILKCALHFSTGDLNRLLLSANSTEPCSLQSLKVQVTDTPLI